MSGAHPDAEVLEHPILMRGFWVHAKLLSVTDAIASVRGSPDIVALSDEQLAQAILQTDQYWKQRIRNGAITDSVVVYPMLMVACAESRLTACDTHPSDYHEGRDKREHRLREWKRIRGVCLASEGMVRLLTGDPPAAWNAFRQSYDAVCEDTNWEPKSWKVRLHALMGMHVSAREGGREDLAAQTAHAINKHKEQTAHVVDASSYIAAVEEEIMYCGRVLKQRGDHGSLS